MVIWGYFRGLYCLGCRVKGRNPKEASGHLNTGVPVTRSPTSYELDALLPLPRRSYGRGASFLWSLDQDTRLRFRGYA